MAPKGIINKKPPLQYVYVSWDEVENIVWELADEMKRRKYVPDVICGIIRGGLIPATMLSHALGIRMITICVGKVGVNYYDFRGKILLAEDINDSGNTLGLISSSLAQIPESGLSPLVSAFPKTRMSGAVLNCASAQSFPAR